MLTEAARLLTGRLERLGTLSVADKQAVQSLVQHPAVHEARTDVFCDGDQRRELHLVLSGFFCRYKLLADGSRQILAILLPGDLCDPNLFSNAPYDFSVGALARGCTAALSRPPLHELFRRPALARAFSLTRHFDDALSREWLVNLGRRGTEQRLVRLLSELTWRLEAFGLSTGNKITLPLVQADLADSIGVTHVHLCRTLKQLQSEGLLRTERGRIVISDVAGLRKAVGVWPSYLAGLISVATPLQEPVAPRRQLEAFVEPLAI
ncbi:Crp/Fnr family transcriptional regulator [Antarcticirhabdus aurantiaca]|uniref:Crp/Fnr family transcriptional regulator n=1 Tax=Antarcticirhabdus aurantiaca TaxID=2606717 RepID=A0ACD4NJE5_9HYPH|nr:Crp/Fnr family transcriptional regulator [Jeongeuplla avenae]